MTHPSKKATHKCSNEEEDKNPPRIKIDCSHKLPLTKKRKNNAGQAEEPEIESEQLKLEIETEHMHKIGSSMVEITKTEFFYEDESFVFQSIVFYSQSKIMVIEKRDVTNRNGKYRTKISFRIIWSSHISSFPQVTGEIFHDSIGGIETKNANLKDCLNEFE